MTSGHISGDRNTAYHEAGHAVAAVLREVPFWIVDIGHRRRNGRGSLGGCARDPNEAARIASLGPDEAMSYLAMLFSGAASERLVQDDERAITDGCRSDEGEALRLAELACPSPDPVGQRDALTRDAREAASNLVANHAGTIREVVDALLHRGGLHRREVEKIVKGQRQPGDRPGGVSPGIGLTAIHLSTRPVRPRDLGLITVDTLADT